MRVAVGGVQRDVVAEVAVTGARVSGGEGYQQRSLARCGRGFRRVDADTLTPADPGGAVSISFAGAMEQAELTIADAGSHRSVLIHRTRGAQ